MFKVRRSEERGHANHGWLDSYHSFSFADYYDPEHMGFGVLRVINEDYIDGGTGFPMHPHRDMEIITYIIDGALEHKDTLGNSTVIRPGEVQRMSAGTGIRHSEFNHFKDQACHLLQIWILPSKEGFAPGYDQKQFKMPNNSLALVATPQGSESAVSLNQNMNMYVGKLDGDKKINLDLQANRHGWLQLISGDLVTPEFQLKAGDALMISHESSVPLEAKTKAHFIFFDLP